MDEPLTLSDAQLVDLPTRFGSRHSAWRWWYGHRAPTAAGSAVVLRAHVDEVLASKWLKQPAARTRYELWGRRS